MPFHIVREDITKMNVDAIVNAANTDLRMGGGVCGAIFKAAGATALQEACNKAAPIKTGGAAITPGFELKAKYVIHAAGPVYSHWSPEQNEIHLRSAYTQSLKLAEKNGCVSIAFPLISSGIYGYPKDKAVKVASKAIRDYLEQSDIEVYLSVLDKESVRISEKLLNSVERYIDENSGDSKLIKRRRLHKSGAPEIKADTDTVEATTMSCFQSEGVDDLLGRLDEPFSATLLRLIDKKGKTDVEVYKKANIDRKLFSKIRTGRGYMPGKRTILALAIALELNLDETDDLLSRAGYALSHSQKFDVIVEYFIISGRYDIFEINEVLYRYDQPSLGC